MKTQKGNAITEFAVSLVVLVPMFLMIPMMGKVADMNSSTIQASRYAAWERTVSDTADKTDDELETELENRFFSKIDIGIQSNRGQLTDDQYKNPLWRGYGDKRLLVSAQNDVSKSVQSGATPGNAAGSIETVMTRFAGAFGALSDNADFDVNMNGLYDANVMTNVGSTTVGENKVGFEGDKNCAGETTNLVFTCIRRHNVILTDAWSSESSEQAENRTRSLVPMGIFSDITPFFEIIGSMPLLKEFGGFEPGYVDSDVIPADRLGKYDEGQ